MYLVLGTAPDLGSRIPGSLSAGLLSRAGAGGSSPAASWALQMQFSAWPLAEAREATCQAGCASSLWPPGLGLGLLVPTAAPGGRFLGQQPSTLKGSGQDSTGSLRFGVSWCSVSYKSGCPLYSEDSYSKILYIGMLPWWLRRVRILLRCGRPGFNSCIGKIPWRRAWPPTPGLLPGESHGQRSLAGYTVHSVTESDTTEAT